MWNKKILHDLAAKTNAGEAVKNKTRKRMEREIVEERTRMKGKTPHGWAIANIPFGQASSKRARRLAAFLTTVSSTGQGE